MPYQLEISDQDRQELVEFYNNKKERLLKELANINANLTKLSANVAAMKDEPTPITKTLLPENGKWKSMGWKNKIDAILKDSITSLSSREIYEAIVEMEPQIKERGKSAFKSITSVLSVHSKKGGRYLPDKENGIILYSLNKNYTENDKQLK